MARVQQHQKPRSSVSEEWQSQLTPYLWALALDGDVTVKGVKSSLSVSFSDIFDHLDYALMIEGEAREGRIGIYANAIYADLSDTDKSCRRSYQS
jgi:hypothetical protein